MKNHLAASALDLQKTSLENALSTLVGSKIQVEFNLNFVESDEFKSLKVEVQVAIVEKLVAHARRFLVSGNGLGEICKKTPAIRPVIQSQVRQIVVTFDPTNTVNSTVSPREYQLKLDKVSLQSIFKLNFQLAL